MYINKDTAISTSRVLLVPYEVHHVPTYHEWMKDEEIQTLTASEPLSMSAEYSMQASWRTHANKLTFIICAPLSSASNTSANGIDIAVTPSIQARHADSPAHLMGDVNIFITPADEEDSEVCIGELEIMIASPTHRRRGYGRAALLAFLRYISMHEAGILDEYVSSLQPLSRRNDLMSKPNEPAPTPKPTRLQLGAKIGAGNAQSIALFESLGFVRVSETPDYFGELSLVLDGLLSEERVQALCDRYGVSDYREYAYVRDHRGDGDGGEGTC